MSHLGINPASGGSPPKDRRRAGATTVRVGVLVQDVANSLMVVVLFLASKRNVAVVMIRYMERARSVSCGENWITIIIHPRWAIEE